MKPGDRVYLKQNPSKTGIVLNEEPEIHHGRVKWAIKFDSDNSIDFYYEGNLEIESSIVKSPKQLLKTLKFGKCADLRGAVTHHRLTGRLADVIYSLNTTNTTFYPYQFKPVLQFLDSPSNGLIIADEVGLGKTIEAGLIWTEMRARNDSKRLLVICPAMLREKWQTELRNRFGVIARIADASELHEQLELAAQDSSHEFALISSMQGLRPPKSWSDTKNPPSSSTARLARFLDAEHTDALVDLLIFDEAHYLKNASTQTHRLVKLLRPATYKAVFLTATPIQTSSTDLFNLLNLLDDQNFAYEGSYDQSVWANEEIIQLRDRVRLQTLSSEEFITALHGALGTYRAYGQPSEQLEYLLKNPPSDDLLNSPVGKTFLADQLDKINPRTKVISRTLKRDVHELRVIRKPTLISVVMSEQEREFYENITEAVYRYCERSDTPEGFLITIPQRQMSSSIQAAYYGWTKKAEIDVDDETIAEICYQAEINQTITPVATKESGLMQSIVRPYVGDIRYFEVLKNEDSKFDSLHRRLIDYWGQYPEHKIVLFAFYKGTLHYLRERLSELGVKAQVLHGGMDKQKIIEEFQTDTTIRILLSSEVAAEGVDLQFSSVLINYDLPWNPAKIEQRIGRIDRIGQLEPVILIWNFVYANTIDERIYTRLLERLRIFEQALGSMEAILGYQIDELTKEFLTHRLSEEDQNRRIDQTRQAIETNKLITEDLDKNAVRLIGHGDFLQQKVEAAKELGRYVSGEDLFAYVNDFFHKHYLGTRLIKDEQAENIFLFESSLDGQIDFEAFVKKERLEHKTRLLSNSKHRLLFENKAGAPVKQIERVTQEHPLIRFVSQKLKHTNLPNLYYATTAIRVAQDKVSTIPRATYVYVIKRTSTSGAKEIERLVYKAISITGESLSPEQSESLVNKAAMKGADWLEASKILDGEILANLYADCADLIDQEFQDQSSLEERENNDRVQAAINSLEQEKRRRTEKFQQIQNEILDSSDENKKRTLPMQKGRYQKEMERIERKISEHQKRRNIKFDRSFVSSGVIQVY